MKKFAMKYEKFKTFPRINQHKQNAPFQIVGM